MDTPNPLETRFNPADNSFFALPPLVDTSNLESVEKDASSESSEAQVQTSYSHSSSASSSEFDGIKCKCVKTKCLQLYCECFHAGILCNEHCKCKECGNSENSLERLSKMASVLKRNSNAFEEENSFVKRRRKEKPGCSCSSSRCLKKYCSCFHNSVECSGNCNCTKCENPHGQRNDERQSNDTFITGDEGANELQPSLMQQLDILNRSPRKPRAKPCRKIEHYNPPNATNNIESLALQKEANRISATANILAVKQMLLQSRHKLFDLEAAHEALAASGADTVRLNRQMGAIREVVNDIARCENDLRTLEVEFVSKYEENIMI